ncbi:SDR family oxidoreductase [Paenibacillus nasutitermitis]|uniref:Short-chain dehydrogenase/reductase n=1 Tax=Paenibacillus nasutitermitis TaxID=1652958 RepID=A0A916ZKL8_9BACL|nr:SDR family oxidoreductase [Paenibacillus nasutitermitis]GGE02189.1 short-chain dehydrogenase/reductase [Paenibacillus nasutitermitis]
MKTILITGASAGIGRASALHFARKGWNVIATMRSPEKETEFTMVENILVTHLDVENKESIHNAIEQGITKFGNIDVIVNNAGYGAFGIFEAATEEQIQRQFDVNVFGPMRVTKSILPHFRKNRQGLIINITSGGGRVAIPLFSLYNASKFALNGLTEALLYELAPLNIRVKIVEPGPTKTEFTGRSMDSLQDTQLTHYSEFEQKIGSVYQSLFDPQQVDPPNLVAEVIYKAATDPSSQLRYHTGVDLMKEREELNEDEFISKMAQRFGIDIP